MCSDLNGAELSYRFIPALAAGGFLLSPMVDDPSSFALLALGESDDLAGKSITDAVISGAPATHLFYELDVAIDLQTVTLKDVVPSREARPFADELNQRRPWRQLVRQITQVADFDGEHLSAPAPTALNVPVSGARRLRLGFGIEDGAWTTGQVKGVCFKVEDVKGGSEPLWQRCLDPHDVVTDRGAQTADVVLPDVMVQRSAGGTQEMRKLKVAALLARRPHVRPAEIAKGAVRKPSIGVKRIPDVALGIAGPVSCLLAG